MKGAQVQLQPTMVLRDQSGPGVTEVGLKLSLIGPVEWRSVGRVMLELLE